MGSKRFNLTIKLGGDAMRTPYDIARALEYVAERLIGDYANPYEDIDLGLTAPIIDANGNRVGKAEVANRKVNEVVAREVLYDHSIRSDWKRTGAQIEALIIEALDKKEEI